ncbi:MULTISPECIES: hypothetical protein [Rhizobium]|uniref:Uncharacterized protein n=1 Tax=Rhizobium leguminosarum TaxID=384 RepID=A0A1B1CPE8_RHILE|nr:hypothetical protein [Rhizobium leguminosarum]ANP91655.1 hypothetical protein BA011_36820 [Rhizobium leguminosarum]API56683.1 hypothetical protein BMW22_34995 [Rhizobium leguminosarum]API57535.1 hypothetical protein BMW22_40130 [Rhizobium leguminosarum]
MTSELFGIASLVVTLIQYAPYCWKTYSGKLRPHVFSYVIWGLGAAIVAGAQWSAGAGPGAWAMALVALLCFAVVALSLRGGAKYVTKTDVWTFLAALGALPIWYFTKDPLFAVIVITVIDIAAFYMIFNKALAHPEEDSILFYAVAAIQYVLSIFATDVFNLTTLLNPVVLIACAVSVIFAMWINRIAVNTKSA